MHFPPATMLNEIVTTEYAAADPTAVRDHRLALIERLADDLAHEIKNPLHSLVINLEVLRRRLTRLEDGTGDELLRYSSILAAELDRANRRIDLLLGLTRPEHRPDATDALADIVAELAELIELECERRGVAARLSTSPRSARLIVRRAPVKHLVLGLVLETLDSLPAGGTLDLGVADEPHAVRLRVRAVASTRRRAPPADAGHAKDFLPVARALAAEIGARVEAIPVAREPFDGLTRWIDGYTLTIPAAAGEPRSTRNDHDDVG